ncbi:MAG: OmpA family protein [Ferruginibacter sp.]|nr:OmpA family protein [Ferruginibacter sp.]
MKQKLLIAVLIAAFPFITNAQIGGVFGKVKSKVNQRVDNRIDKAIDKTLDKAEGKETAGSSPEVKESRQDAKPDEPVVASFSKYDFIPGEQIVYYDNFEQQPIAELPTGWNTNGTGEVVTLGNIAGKWLRIHQPFNYLTSNEKEFSENYSVEFDVVMQLKNNGWMYPTFSIGIFGTNGEAASGNDFLKGFKKYAAVIATINPGEFKNSRIILESFNDNKTYFKSDAKSVDGLEKYYGKPVHIAIQVQKERYRIWINEAKAFDVPKGVASNYKMNQLLFQVGQTNYKDDQYGMYISNIKVAQGLPDTRHKLVEEGKFSTTAILFDVNEATIKPESGGVLKEIAGVMNEYKDFKVFIIGHTDSDGSDIANLALSKKRAAAVKDALVNEFNIDAARIETDGKGETVEVGDNKTKEGKAQNRRVEFIKR